MLGFFFGFNMRLGRLHYFLSSLGIGVVFAAIIFSMVAFVFRNTGPGTAPSTGALLIPALFFVPVVLWVTTSLMSMRIRDIGWNPAYVIPAWLLVCLVDAYVALDIPAFAIGGQTIVGGLSTLVFLWLCSSGRAVPMTARRQPSASPAAQEPNLIPHRRRLQSPQRRLQEQAPADRRSASAGGEVEAALPPQSRGR
jgi:uncharacterized membrane protein YhaH (DUF805 family)